MSKLQDRVMIMTISSQALTLLTDLKLIEGDLQYLHMMNAISGYYYPRFENDTS